MKHLTNISALKGSAIAYMLVFAAFGMEIAYGLPAATFVAPTASDNATAFLNRTYINISSSEDLNQSFVEWGNASGFTNVTMANESYIRNWSVNMTGLVDGIYNYTIWMENTTGNWSQSERRYVVIDTAAPYAIRRCQNLMIEGGSYVLGQNVSSAGTCFGLLNNSITLDGAGYTVNYSYASAGYAINNSLGYNSTTIKNLNILQGSTSVGAHAIFFRFASNNVLFNNTITTSGLDSAGIYLNASASNNITGGSIVATGGSAYYLEDSGTTNNFTSTNITALRNITFADTTSWLNYQNDSAQNIWLKTNMSAASTMTRSLTNWNSSSMQWNDTNGTAGLTANYILTGLSANTVYYVYNTSVGAQTNTSKISDSGGSINFTIWLNSNTEIIVDAAPVITIVSPPASGFYHNTSTVTVNVTLNEAGSWCGVSLNGTANQTLNSSSTIAWGGIITVPYEGINNVTFWCNDARGILGNSSTIAFTKDVTKPIITSISSGTPASTGATISWNTNEYSNSIVFYGKDQYALSLTATSGNGTSHSVPLSSLDASSTYYYNVSSCDRAGNCNTSTQNSFITASATNTSSTSTDSSGGSSSSSSTSKTWAYIANGGTATMAISSSSLYVTQIDVTVKQAVSNAKLSVSRFTSKPAGTATAPEGSAYQYMSITAENLPESKISDASITFKVSTKWMSDNNIDSSKITLYRYSGGAWNALSTYSAKGSTSDYTNYVADTPGFSYFAIVGKAKSAPAAPAPKKNATNTSSASGSAQENQNSAGLNNNSTPNASSQNNITAESSGSSSSSSAFILIAVLLVASVAAYYIKTKQPTKWKTSNIKHPETKPEDKKSALIQLPKPQYSYKPQTKTKNSQILDLIKESVNAPKKKVLREQSQSNDGAKDAANQKKNQER